jgi:hypothetical protein
MSLTMDPDGRQTRRFDCPCCAAPIDRSWNLVRRGGAPVALYYASCYPHADGREAWLDVVFGSWAAHAGAVDGASADAAAAGGRVDVAAAGPCMDVAAAGGNVTFGCRIGPVAGHAGPAATVVDGGLARDGDALFGRRLRRWEALAHPLLPRCWELVDFIVAADPQVERHVHGASPAHRPAIPGQLSPALRLITTGS